MRKITLEADEKYAIAVFQEDNRKNTIDAIEEALPFVEDDLEIFQLLSNCKEKLIQMSDLEYRQIDFKVNPFVKTFFLKN